jgi:choline transporter-like protein 2/4/5
MNMLTSIFEKLFPFDDDGDDDTVITPKNMLKKLSQSTSFVSDTIGDLYSARKQILIFGFGVSVFLAFLYSQAMAISIVTKTVVWGSIFSIFFAGIAIAGFAKYQAGVWEYEIPKLRTDKDIKIMTYVSNGGFGFAVFWLLFILYMRDRLNLAIGLVIETARALTTMPLLVIFIPVFQVTFYALFTIPWLFFLVYMAAMGNITTATSSFQAGIMTIDYAYKEFNYDKQQQDLAWFYLFGYFWTSEFIIALGQIITAMALCCYYFTRDKSRIGNCTVLKAMCLIIRYHLGTVAFGSCIVALVRLLRAYVDYLEKTALKNETELQKLLMKCLKCMMWCIERCIKYINFNAYIQTCIWGTTFCVSGFNAFWLIFRNLARIVAVTGVTGFLSFIGKITVILLTGGSFYYVVNLEWPHLVKSLIVPTILVMIIATCVAIMFFEVFGMGTTVLLQCYIADEEMFKNDTEGCFATDSLKSYLQSKGKKKKKKKKEAA